MHFSNDTDLYRVIGANIKYYREQANLYGLRKSSPQQFVQHQYL